MRPASARLTLAPLAARMRPRTLDELVGQEHVLGEGSALRRAIEAGPAAVDDPLRAAGLGQDDAGADRRGRDRRRLRGAVGRLGRVAEVRGVIAAGARPARRQRPADDLLPRRDPPLQQGPAGRAAAGGRGGAADADRGDDREPVLRGQLGAALALPGLRAGGARPRRSSPRSSVAARRRSAPDVAGRDRRADRAPGRRRRAHRARRARARVRRPRRPRATPLEERHVEDAARKRPLLYDKDGDQHYDFISAWIKATRGSDPDASLYYLAVMLEGGEDPRFIARRMVIFASEDVGNADPQALLVAVAAAQAVEHVGLPEARSTSPRRRSTWRSRRSRTRAPTRSGRRARTSARGGQPAAAGHPARRPLPRREEARARRGLHLPAHRPARASRSTTCPRS